MARKTIDWESVELQYRAGIRSLKDIGSEFGCSDAAIIKRAKRDGWVRDLSAKIQAKAEAKVSASLVSKEVSAQTRIREQEIIEANADAVASVRLAHRRDIQRARSISMNLFAELEHQTGIENAQLLEQLGEIMRDENDKGVDKLNDAYMKIISLPGRVKSMKDLSDTLKNLVALEREAFGLNDKENNAVDALTSLLTDITSNSNNAFMPVSNDPEYEDDED